MPASRPVNGLTQTMAAEAAALYALHAPLIDKKCRAFVARYGGDYDVVRGNANTHFMRAYLHHKNGKGATNFATELGRWIWYEEFDRMRTERQYRTETKCLEQTGHELDTTPAPRATFNVVDFLDGLSQDAQECARLILDTPAELAAVAVAKGGTDHNMRSSLRQYLRHAGWTAERVRDAFTEVAGALV